MLERDLKKYLLDDETIRSMVTDRLHPIVLMQQESGSQKKYVPAATYQRMPPEIEPESSMDIASSFSAIPFQFICWDIDYDRAKDLSEAIRLRINGFNFGTNGKMYDSTILGIFWQGEWDDYEPNLNLFQVYSAFEIRINI